MLHMSTDARRALDHVIGISTTNISMHRARFRALTSHRDHAPLQLAQNGARSLWMVVCAARGDRALNGLHLDTQHRRAARGRYYELISPRSSWLRSR